MKKQIVGVKRLSSLVNINSHDDLIMSDDVISDMAKKIFIHHYISDFKKIHVSLYQCEPRKHSTYPNIIVNPPFITDNGTVIYLQLIHNGVYLKMIKDDIIQLAMNIYCVNKAKVFTIEMNPEINVNVSLFNHLINDVTTLYLHIDERQVIYSEVVAKSYIASLSRKRLRMNPYLNNDKYDLKSEQNSISQTKDSDIFVFNKNDWISASKTRNYAQNNTLVDWLERWYYDSDEQINENLISKQIYRTPTNNHFNFIKFIMEKGKEFELLIIELIKKKVNQDEFVTVCHNMIDYNNKILEYEETTIEHIKKGTPIIYQAILMNRSGELSYSYGSPDLLIRSDYLSKIMQKNPLDKTMIYHKAPNLIGNYHYVVVDIKFITLNFCVDGEHLRNTENTAAFKCQLYIYNHALGRIQGYEPPRAYILGRKYKYIANRISYSSNNCFARLGHVDYDSWDKCYIQKTIEAIKWIKNLRVNGNKWKLLPTPSVPELYPNMTCSSSSWDSIKLEYAKKIGEITLLWNCGIKNRKIGHKNGIYSFFDNKCNSQIIGIKGEKQSQLLDEVIQINREQNFKTPMDRIKMIFNPELSHNWLETEKLLFVVDFETINSVFDDFSKLPHSQNNDYLFMIGVAWKFENKIEYKSFVISKLDKQEEFNIIRQLYHYLREITDKFLGKEKQIPPLYHWGHIENSYFLSLCNKLEKYIDSLCQKDLLQIKQKLRWFNLLDYFKSNPIVINGCFGFGLKEISTRLAELGLIKTNWSQISQCKNGNSAMVMAHLSYQMIRNDNISIIDIPFMKEIIEYNKIDCMVIQEIIDLLKIKFIEYIS